MLTYSQVQAQLKRPKGRKILVDFARHVVRKEFLAFYCANEKGMDHLLHEEERQLQTSWYDLRKWAYQLGLLDTQAKKTVLQALIGLIISTAGDYPGVTKKTRIEAVQRILARGFQGLFTDPDPTPSG